MQRKTPLRLMSTTVSQSASASSVSGTEGDGDPVRADAGVVEGEVERAEAGDDRVHHGGHLGLVGDVALDEHRLTARGLDLCGDLLGGSHTPPGDDGHFGAFRRQGESGHPADAGRASGDYRDFSCDASCHARRPSSWSPAKRAPTPPSAR